MSYVDDYSNSTIITPNSLDDYPNNLIMKTNKKEQKTKFYHFSKSKDCETFMKIINPLYKITNTCCYSNEENGYKGFGVDSSYEIQVNIKYNKFIKDLEKAETKPLLSKLHFKYNKSVNDVCCICLENCNYITFCKHVLCKECLQKGESDFNLKLCPICRNDLKEF